MTSLAERLAETRRRLTLDILLEAEGRLSDAAIRNVLGHYHMESTDIETVRADMAWFERHMLAAVERMERGAAAIWVATLTAAGQSVARGRRHIGVADRDAR
jgi:hypothetical protein